MTVTTHSYDPCHGDLNNRYPRLGAPVKRVVSREQWHNFRHTQPASMNNGIFGYVNKQDATGMLIERDERHTQLVMDALREARLAFGQEPEPRSA